MHTHKRDLKAFKKFTYVGYLCSQQGLPSPEGELVHIDWAPALHCPLKDPLFLHWLPGDPLEIILSQLMLDSGKTPLSV